MDKIKTVAIDFVCVFLFVFLSSVTVDMLSSYNWATWKEAVFSSITSAIGVVIAALSPVVSRYGFGTKK